VSGLICDYGAKFQIQKDEAFEPKPKLCFLAISTTWNRVSFSTYILFLTELQKKQTLKKRFALFKKRYHNNF